MRSPIKKGSVKLLCPRLHFYGESLGMEIVPRTQQLKLCKLQFGREKTAVPPQEPRAKRFASTTWEQNQEWCQTSPANINLYYKCVPWKKEVALIFEEEARLFLQVLTSVLKGFISLPRKLDALATKEFSPICAIQTRSAWAKLLPLLFRSVAFWPIIPDVIKCKYFNP